MVRVDFSRKDYRVVCDGCGEIIEIEAPSYEITLGAEKLGEQGESTVSLCEDCGNDLQNDICDEYSKFVEPGK